MDQHDKGRSIADQQAKGLQRLQAAIVKAGVHRLAVEHVAARQRRVRLCLLVQPGDTYETISARHPEQGTPLQVQQAVLRIRARVAKWLKTTQIPAYEIAQAYLNALPPHYRLPTDD
jgi:hypothetical protein